MNRWFFIFSFFLCTILYGQQSYIQIKAEPNIIVYLDNNKVGVTSSSIGGLIIENVSSGRHKLKFERDGYISQEESITLSQGQVYEYYVQSFTPKVKVTQRGRKETKKIERATGNLRFQSLPVDIGISIAKLGINSKKDQDLWLAEELPVGEYEVKFSWNSKSISKIISVSKNTEKHFFVNMLDGSIKEKSSEEVIYSPAFHREYYDNGQIKVEIGTNKSKTINHGALKEWSSDGLLTHESHYKNGVQVGVSKDWFTNGQLRHESYFENGELIGTSRSWHNNGQLWSERKYENGEIVKQTWWHENGQMNEQQIYNNGKSVGGKTWNSDGKLIKEWK